MPENYDNDLHLASDFNSSFHSKISDMRKSLMESRDQDLSIETASCSVSSPITPLDCFTPVTIEELQELISEMDIKTSPEDPLPSTLLKSSLPILLPYILELVKGGGVLLYFLLE